jgi:uncharacterized protein (TIGR02453 family)
MSSFGGWPADALDFYAALEADNSRPFWLANKSRYEAAVKGPILALSEMVEKEFGPLHVFRPNRDVRFAKDKSPYKTACGAVTEGADGGAYYLQISAEGLFAGSGYYHLAADQLERWRESVADPRRGAALEKVVTALTRAKYEIGSMESLKTAPRGYPKDHPRIELLRRKGLTAGKTFGAPRWLHTKVAADRIVQVWHDAKPMNRWLGKHVGPSTSPPPEPG